MEGLKRKPFQGITNIIRFNWHYYVIAFALLIALFFSRGLFPRYINLGFVILGGCILIGTIISLVVSWYIYDHSNLYSLDWLKVEHSDFTKQLVNITAGFDETSSLLLQKFPGSDLQVFDFYDPARHTEISIERARKRNPGFPGTKVIQSNDIPVKAESIDYIFLLLAAHEIRNKDERISFFKQCRTLLRPEGRIILTEHQRDINNFIAYNFGFFHFFSPKNWKQIIAKAGLIMESEIKITPFISTYILKKNGMAP